MIPQPEMNTPLVSVVIPTYNRAEYLREALDSALTQTYSSLEVIVTDDGSTDGTDALVASYDDPRVRYRRNPTTLGQTMNNREGFRAAQGKYVANLHDDDRWSPNFLASLVPALETHDDVTIAFCDHWVMDADGSIRKDLTDLNTAHFRRDQLAPGLHLPFYRIALLDLSIPTVMGAVMRRSALPLDAFTDDVDPIYDLWMSYLLCRHGQAAYYHPERLTYYRVHGNQESGRTSHKKTNAHLYCYQRFLSDGFIPSLRTEFEAQRTKHAINSALHHLRDGDPQTARRMLRREFFQNPVRSLLPLLLSFFPARKAQYIAAETQKNRPLWSILRGALRA